MPSTTTFDAAAIRADFPALAERVHGRPLVYLDNAATAQKPRVVLDAIDHYYSHDNSNVHRGVHTLSERATAAYEAARETTRAFINAASTHEVVFTRNATESINLVARAWGDANVHQGDHVLITTMEHHSNIVPWQMLCERVGATLDAVPIDDRGDLVMAELERLLTPRTKIVAVTHQSNALGTINPVADIVKLARQAGAAHARRRIAGRLPPAGGRAGDRRGLLRVHGAQAVRADGDGRACTAARPCSRRCRRSWAAAT